MPDPANWTDRSIAAFSRIDALMQEGQHDAAVFEARKIGNEAQNARKPRVVIKAGEYLERLEDYVFAARLLAAGGLLQKPSPVPEWDGSPLEGRRLIIVQRIRHVGAPLRLSRLIPLAAKRAEKCLVLTEPRLVPLFARSFPGLDICETGKDDERAFARADVAASYETLTQHLLDEDIRSERAPVIKPDPLARDRFRRKYETGKLIIGISWHSTNAKKDVPSLEDWAQFIHASDATFVSIQYGAVAFDLEVIRRLSGKDVIEDPEVDALNNLDLFAAQVAAVNSIVTISNTGAHMAGALGVPTSVILDDKNHLTWPAHERQSGWYRSTTLIRRQNRTWRNVFDEVTALLRGRFDKV